MTATQRTNKDYKGTIQTVSTERMGVRLVEDGGYFHIDLRVGNTTLKIDGQPQMSKLLGYLQLHPQTVYDECYIDNGDDLDYNSVDPANIMIKQALAENKIPHGLKLLFDDEGNITRVTTSMFHDIDTAGVADALSKRLTAEGYKYERSVNPDGTMYKYLFSEVDRGTRGAEMMNTLHLWNSNSGADSVKLVGGAEVLVCSNGLTATKTMTHLSKIHKSEPKVIETQIDRALSKILPEIKMIPQHVLALRKCKVSKPEAKLFVRNLKVPKRTHDNILNRLFKASEESSNGHMDWDGTMYGLYMACTYLSSHAEVEGAIRASYKYYVNDLKTWQDMWDQRKEILTVKTPSTS